MTTHSPADARDDDALCACCGAPVPMMAALVYHGVVYHPACVAPTLRRDPRATTARDGRPPRRHRGM
jgi:hypothetical protein